MKLGQQTDADPRLATLVAADDATAEDSSADAIVLPCGSTVPQLEIKLLVWNVREFGGGFHTPSKRPDHAMDSYAALIAALAADVCVVTGLRGIPARLVTSESGVLRYADESLDTGVAEAKRVLAALQKASAADAWTIAVPMTDANAVIYEGGLTAVVLYKTAGGRKMLSFDIVNGRSDAALGIGGHLVHLSLELPLDDADPLTMELLAPLGALAEETEKAPAVTGTLPDSFVLAFSADDDLASNSSPLDAVQSAVSADSRPLLGKGSVMGDHFWARATNETGALLSDFTAVSPADLDRQDEEMFWEALPEPEHPTVSTDVAGSLGDAVLVRNAESRAQYVVKELRVVDMMRAALTADELETAGGEGAAGDEDHALADLRATHRTATAYLKPEAPTTPQNIVAECADFLHLLSDHWPVLATLVVRAPASH